MKISDSVIKVVSSHPTFLEERSSWPQQSRFPSAFGVPFPVPDTPPSFSSFVAVGAQSLLMKRKRAGKLASRKKVNRTRKNQIGNRVDWSLLPFETLCQIISALDSTHLIESLIFVSNTFKRAVEACLTYCKVSNLSRCDLLIHLVDNQRFRNIAHLDIAFCSVVDISAFASLQRLRSLRISSTAVRDLSAFEVHCRFHPAAQL